MAAVAVFYTEEMVVESGSRSRSSEKPRSVLAAWEAAGLAIERHAVVPATLADFALAHDRGFVTAVLAGKIDNGFYNRRLDIARTFPYTTGAMLGAARHGLEAGVACAPVSGFHHAGYASAAGFCTFNGLLVAALRVLQEKCARRVMILDCDQHFGDGTEEILGRLQSEAIENVTFGRWFAVPADADAYLARLERETRRFPGFDLILYQAGADVHVDDPLGGVLNSEQMRERDRLVFTAARASGVPMAWNLAGGYQEPLSRVVALHVNTMRECVAAYH